MHCQRIAVSLSAYLDDALPLAERDRIDAHIDRCAACHGQLKELRAIAAMTALLPVAAAPQELKYRILNTIAREEVAARHGGRVRRWSRMTLGATRRVTIAIAFGFAVACAWPHRPSARRTPLAPPAMVVASAKSNAPGRVLARSRKHSMPSLGGHATHVVPVGGAVTPSPASRAWMRPREEQIEETLTAPSPARAGEVAAEDPRSNEPNGAGMPTMVVDMPGAVATMMMAAMDTSSASSAEETAMEAGEDPVRAIETTVKDA